MATWIWRWRRTMLEKARWIARTGFRRFARHGITSRKCRMLISGRVRDAWKRCGAIRTRSGRTPIRAGGLFSPTIESLAGARETLRDIGACKAGMLAGQNFLHRGFARVSPVFLVAGVALLCVVFTDSS